MRLGAISKALVQQDESSTFPLNYGILIFILLWTSTIALLCNFNA